jgi:hypothetical protein
MVVELLGQATHTEPATGLIRPAPHTMQLPADVAPTTGVAVPTGQGLQGPPLLPKKPTLQTQSLMASRLVDSVPVVTELAGQLLQFEVLVTEVKVFGGHTEHARLPAVSLKVPTPHAVQSVAPPGPVQPGCGGGED